MIKTVITNAVLKTCSILDISEKPFDILGDSSSNKVQVTIGDPANPDAGFSLGEVGYLLKQGVLYIGLLTCMGCVIALMLVRKDTKIIAEKKSELYHKLLLVFLAGCAATLFGGYKQFLDGLFHF